MKIYHLIIAYNDKTEEIEYIQEELEDDGNGREPFEFTAKMDPEYFDDDTLIRLIEDEGLAEA